MGLYFMYDKLARGWSREGTLTGKYHIVYLFLFRVLILFTVGRKIYEDELTAFRCNTIQPGCTTMCYNAVFPISHLRFWYFQIVVTLMPYFAFGAYVMVTSDDDVKNTEEQTVYVQNIPMRSLQQITRSRRALSTQIYDYFPMKKLYAIRKGFLSHEDIYEIQCVVRMVLEVVFLCLQQLLFGFEVAATIQCEEFPCPRKIRCHPAKTTEKSFMLAYSFCVGVVSVFFGVYELLSMHGKKKEKTTAAPQNYGSLFETFNYNIECEDRLRYDEDDNTLTSDSTISDHSGSDADPSDDESEDEELEDDGYDALGLQPKDRCKRRYHNGNSESGSSSDGDTERGDDVSEGSPQSSQYEYGLV